MKKVVIACLALICVGALLGVAGGSLGADKTVKWSNGAFSAGEAAVKAEELPAFTSLDVSAGSAKIEARPGEHYSYAVYNADADKLTVKNADGTLRIELKNSLEFNLYPLANLSGDQTPKIVVTYPPNAQFSSFSVAVTSGSVLADGVHADLLALTAVSGEITATNALVQQAVVTCTSGSASIDGMSAQALTLSVVSGRATAKNLKTRGLSAAVHSGKIRIAGELLGDTSLSVGSGDVTLDLNSPASAYRRDFTVGSGSVYVNGVPTLGKDTNSAAKNSLSASVTSGGININFAPEDK